MQTLPADLVDYVQDSIARGDYDSEQDLLSDAVRLHRERTQKLADLRNELQIGIAQLQRGEGAPLDIDAIKAEVRRRR